ncbi:MAG TPA: hypothetical protein DDZ88_06395 [Verrucomicrobiales bacterium]|nr:hypothetical protein [Verrucomicrobiales bacterium]
METTIPPQRGAFIAKLGAWLQVAAALGIVGAIFAVSNASKVLSAPGVDDPSRFSEAIGDVLVCALIAVRLSLVGLVLVTIALTVFRYRSKWMYQMLCYFGLFSIGLSLCQLVFGYHLITWHLMFGVFFLIFALVKKEEFIRSVPPKRPLPSCYNLDP